MSSGPSLHHIGCVVDSIERRIDSYRASLRAAAVSQVFEDPIQRSRVVLLDLPGPGLLQFELVEPSGPDSPVSRFLEKGGGLHHLCYEVDDLDKEAKIMKAQRAMMLRPPRPAVAFGGRRIAWFRTADAMLIEHLQRT